MIVGYTTSGDMTRRFLHMTAPPVNRLSSIPSFKRPTSVQDLALVARQPGRELTELSPPELVQNRPYATSYTCEVGSMTDQRGELIEPRVDVRFNLTQPASKARGVTHSVTRIVH